MTLGVEFVVMLLVRGPGDGDRSLVLAEVEVEARQTPTGDEPIRDPGRIDRPFPRG